jgi:hypothetical protein
MIPFSSSSPAAPPDSAYRWAASGITTESAAVATIPATRKSLSTRATTPADRSGCVRQFLLGHAGHQTAADAAGPRPDQADGRRPRFRTEPNALTAVCSSVSHSLRFNSRAIAQETRGSLRAAAVSVR